MRFTLIIALLLLASFSFGQDSTLTFSVGNKDQDTVKYDRIYTICNWSSDVQTDTVVAGPDYQNEEGTLGYCIEAFEWWGYKLLTSEPQGLRSPVQKYSVKRMGSNGVLISLTGVDGLPKDWVKSGERIYLEEIVIETPSKKQIKVKNLIFERS